MKEASVFNFIKLDDGLRYVPPRGNPTMILRLLGQDSLREALQSLKGMETLGRRLSGTWQVVRERDREEGADSCGGESHALGSYLCQEERRG